MRTRFGYFYFFLYFIFTTKGGNNFFIYFRCLCVFIGGDGQVNIHFSLSLHTLQSKTDSKAKILLDSKAIVIVWKAEISYFFLVNAPRLYSYMYSIYYRRTVRKRCGERRVTIHPNRKG